MGSVRELPPISRSQSVISECNRLKSRGSKRSRRQLKDRVLSKQITSPRIKELVVEDVYLMDNKSTRFTANLLANSLTARLRKNLPDGVIESETIKRIRRDSLKDFIHLDNLHRQYNSDFLRENSRLDKESYQLLKRQKHLQKQSEMSRRKQDKLESSLRSRSGLSSASLPPLLANNDAHSLEQTTGGFPEFATVDKDDQSHVKVFKLKGIYQPTNKYSSRIEPFEISQKAKTTVLKEASNIQDSLRIADNGSPLDLPSKSRLSKKGLRVSWSRNSRFYPDAEMDSAYRAETRASNMDMRSDTVSPDREVNVRTPPKRLFNSRLSTRSDTFLIQSSKTFKGRRKIETIGLQWKLPPKLPVQTIPEVVPQPRPGREPNAGLSHNLMPVTTAMEKEGRSTKKVCWQVQRPQCLSRMEMYQSWIDKLEILKARESVESSLNIPNRALNLSVMTQPV